ncbi:HlyD family secretion protein [Roseibium sp.]|uniref:HlyD family secretion protein n=1 Tax=Roseibium sp. TaxID=1936156 RepID=UPI003D0DB57E
MAEETAAPSAETDPQRRVRRLTLILLALMALLFAWYLVADRLTPYTAAGRVQAFVVALSPDVSGYVSRVNVDQNQLVEAGQPLFQLDPKRFEVAVRAAEAALEEAGQSVGANTASVAGATASLVKAQAELDEARVQAERVFALEKKGIYAKAKGDEARSRVATSEALVAQAAADLERSKEQLGALGEDNPKVRAALASLETAQLDLARTVLSAPSRGHVANIDIDVGTYATAGQPLLTFISAEEGWVEAYFTENNLGNMKVGDKVDLAFDAYPGRIFKGEVTSLPVGVATGTEDAPGTLTTAQQSTAWLRDPQRFPVLIGPSDVTYSLEDKNGVRFNSQVDVIVYTGSNSLWNTLGGIWIRLVSFFSYLY